MLPRGTELERSAHVWLAEVGSFTDARQLARFRSVLSDEERRKCDRFYFPRDAHLYLVSHALVRWVLSRYTSIELDSWRFSSNRYGRPEIAPTSDLRFNLSHTHGLAAVVVTQGIDCGVDVEKKRDMNELLDLARSVFSVEEVASLLPMDGPAQRERFFVYWTLKESYIKGRGMGLSLPLQEFTFGLEPSIQIHFGPGLRDDPAAWQFARYSPTPEHAMAVALRTGGKPDREIQVYSWSGL